MTTKVPASQAKKSTNYNRVNAMGKQREQLAGSKADVSTLMLYDARANPNLYREVGVKARSTLSTDETMALCNEMSGALGAAVRRWLKNTGIKLASKNSLRAEASTMWHESETGTIVVDDPKRKGKVITAAYLVVKDLHKVMQKTLNQQAAGGILMWSSNIPHDQVWVEVNEDKGGGTTKLLLKFLNILSPDSVYCTVAIGFMDRLEDKYNHLKVAFGHIYEQINLIRRRGLCVYAPWVQRLPPGFVARDEDQFPMEIARQAVLRMKERYEPPKKASRKRGGGWEKPPLPATVPKPPKKPAAPPPSPVPYGSPPSPPPPPKQQPSSQPSSSTLPLLPISKPTADPFRTPSRQPKAEPQPLLSRPPSPLSQSSPPLPSSPSPPLPSAPSPPLPSSPVRPPTQALCAECVDPDIDVDLDEPPTERRPNCWMCSRDVSWQSSGRTKFTFGGCPTAKREAHATNGPGPVQPILAHHCESSLRLKGCTWSPDCPDCRKSSSGQLDALIRQWGMVPAAERGRSARKIKLFQGGDFLSVAEPLGHGGPSSKKFCLFCLGSLHETNVAGVPHLRTMPPGHEEVRAASPCSCPTPR